MSGIPLKGSGGSVGTYINGDAISTKKFRYVAKLRYKMEMPYLHKSSVTTLRYKVFTLQTSHI